MFGKRKKTLTLKVFVVLLSLLMTTAAFSARITPSGKVVMMKDGNVIGEFSNEAPLPEGVLLKCEGKCSIMLDDVYMVVDPGTVFSVQPMADRHEVFVQEGTVYFSVTESSRPMQFDTPGGVVTTRETSLTGSELKGYVRVSGQETEIGVIQGGTMRVETASGEMVIASGNQITITVAESATAASGAGAAGGSTLVTDIALGVVGAAIIVGGIYGLHKVVQNGGPGGDGSPSSP